MQSARQFGMEIWAYCLMTNHVHLIAVPRDAQSLGLAIGRAHQRYGSALNARRGCKGHLWANRYFSAPLDDARLRLWTAAKYIELNPVRAGVVSSAVDCPYSSAACNAGAVDDTLL